MSDPLRQTLLAPVYEVAVETPLQLAENLSLATGNQVYLKREDMQPVHSFKIRGAYNKIITLTEAERQTGVIAASAGNHAQGVALSARKFGISATIVMPRTTPSIKVEAVRNYGADIILAGDSYSEAYEACQQLITSSGKTFIHPFNDPAVIAGQGTVGREILEQLPDVEYIFVPVGGGGLIAGIAQYVKLLRPEACIIGVEPEDSNAMQASLAAGKPVTLDHVGVFADGVAVKYVGDLTFALCQQYVDIVITVTNDQICAAIKSIFEDTRSIMEPAGALSVAGALAYIEDQGLQHRKIATICSGANIPFEKLQFVAERTLLGSGREALYAIDLPEQPGALAGLCQQVVGNHNITEFGYRLTNREKARILVGVSMAGRQDRQAFSRLLAKHHYSFVDLSEDDIAKEHIRHMIGGSSSAAKNEHIFEINFPERPGALREFLQAIGIQCNISLFHYRGQGGDVGKVLIGLEAATGSNLSDTLQSSGYDFVPVSSNAVRAFISTGDQ